MNTTITASWAGIEQCYLDGDNYTQLEFRWVADSEGKPSHREYRLSGILDGKAYARTYDTPDEPTRNFGFVEVTPYLTNKTEAYEAYWGKEEELLAL